MNKICKEVVECLSEHKAEEISTIDVKNLTPFASYYVIATCPNPRALKAISEEVGEDLEKHKHEITAVDGTAESGWIVVASEDIMVHLFLERARIEIGLDELLDKGKSVNKKK